MRIREPERCIGSIEGHSNWFKRLIELQNGLVASASSDETVKIWDMSTKTCLVSLTGHTHNVMSLIQLKNGNIISGSMDETII